MEKREKGNLYRELEEYREMGIPLYLNGRESTPGRIARAYRIAEEGDPFNLRFSHLLSFLRTPFSDRKSVG